MYVLTAAQMREVDRQTVELGIPDPVLMENAGHRVVEFLQERFAPLTDHRIVILCGKGNNGGDGLVIARQLFTRIHPRSLDIVLAEQAPANLPSLLACGCKVHDRLAPEMRAATIVIDALLGTGLSGPPRDPYESLIREINEAFPAARIVAVDIPSGLASDTAETSWPHVRAHHTVTFTAPKLGQLLSPNAEACGELRVVPIGTPPSVIRSESRWSEPADFRSLFTPRPKQGHKGTFGHVLVIGGWDGKTGAAAMAGISALRAGAGLVTVGSLTEALTAISSHAPELMTEPVAVGDSLSALLAGKTVLAIGPGLGVDAEKRRWVLDLVRSFHGPVVLDADALNNIAGSILPRRANIVLTPHPGEMARLAGLAATEVQTDRIGLARRYATGHGITLVLKGRNTLTTLPDGEVWINSTGGPAMATGGAGDILTGLIAGLAAQFPDQLRLTVAAAVWLHGRAGDLAAVALGEKSVIATDLLRFLPPAMEECARLHHAL